MPTEKIYDEKRDEVYVESASNGRVANYDEDVIRRGSVLLEDEMNLGLWASARLHWRPLLCSSVAFTAAMMFGYDQVANGASLAMPAFFLYFGDIGPTGPYLPSIWTSLWSAMSSLSFAIGAFCVGFIADRFGRKWTGSAVSSITLVGTAIQFVAKTRGVLLAGKMVGGLGIGAALPVGISYASEVAPPRLRGIVQQGIILFTVVMFALALGIVRIFVPDVRESAFRTVFAIQWAVGALATVAFALVPESPVYLVTNNRSDAAHRALSRIYGSNSSIDARLANLEQTIREEQSNRDLQRASYLECFKGDNLKRTLTSAFIYTAVAWGGAALLTQNIIFLIIAGLEAIHAFDIGIGGFGLSILIIIASWFVSGKIQRRLGFLVGCVINFLFMLIIGALYYAPGTGALWAVAILMNLLITFQTSIIQNFGYPIAAEVSSYRLRAKTIAIGQIAQAIVTWLMSFVVPYMYNVDSGNLGARTGFIFMGLSLILIVIGFYLVPDTTNMTPAEIDQAYADKIPPRQFGKHFTRKGSFTGGES